MTAAVHARAPPWWCTLIVLLLLRPGLLGVLGTPGADQQAAAEPAHGNWIGAVLDQLRGDAGNRGSHEMHSADTNYAPESVQGFVLSVAPEARRYVAVLDRLGLTDWQVLEPSYGSPTEQQEVMEAVRLSHLLLTESHRRRHILAPHTDDRAPAPAARPAAASQGPPATASSAASSASSPDPSSPASSPPAAASSAASSASSPDPSSPASSPPAPPGDSLPPSEEHADLPWTRIPPGVPQYRPEEQPGEKHKQQLAADPVIIEITGIKALAEAALRIADRGRLLLVTTSGTTWALSALNAVYFLHLYGFHGVLPVLSSLRECTLLVHQDIAPVRTCAWVNVGSVSDYSNDKSWPFNRLLWLEQLARLGYQVLMADTDVCYTKDPFAGLENSKSTIVTSGSIGDFNLGLLYANGRNPAGIADLGLLTEVNRRLRAMVAEVAAQEGGGGGQDGDGEPVSEQVLNDQNLVNDVLHEWVAPARRRMYVRSCLKAALRPGQCFSHCCDQDQQELVRRPGKMHAAVSRDTKAFVDAVRAGQAPSVYTSDLGKCLKKRRPYQGFSIYRRGWVACTRLDIAELPDRCSEFGVVHMNTCHDVFGWYPDKGFNTSAAVQVAGHAPANEYWHNHFNWLRGNCWAPGLTDLAKQWVVSCFTEECRRQHPDAPVEQLPFPQIRFAGDRDWFAFDEF